MGISVLGYSPTQMDSDGDAAAAFETKAGSEPHESEVSALPWLQQARMQPPLPPLSQRTSRLRCNPANLCCHGRVAPLSVQRLRCPKLLATNNFKKKVSRQVV